MLYFRGSWFVGRVILFLTLVTFLSACQKWVALEPPYAPLQGEYEKLRVTTDSGTRVVINDPRQDADSLWGIGSDGLPTAVIPILSVQKIEKRGTNWLGSVGLAYLGLNVLGGVAMLVECSGNPESMLC